MMISLCMCYYFFLLFFYFFSIVWIKILSTRRLRPRKIVYSHCEIEFDWIFYIDHTTFVVSDAMKLPLAPNCIQYMCMYISLSVFLCLCMFATERRNATVSMITQSMRLHTVYYTHDRKTTNAKWTKDEKSAAILLYFVRHTTFLYRFLTRASVRPMCTLTTAHSCVFFPNIYSNGVK